MKFNPTMWLACAAAFTANVPPLSVASPEIPPETKFILDIFRNIPPQDEFFIYDIKGADLTTDDVNKAFEAVLVVYKFKVRGARHYYIVVKNTEETQSQLAALDIPGATEVEVFTAERAGDYFRSTGVEGLDDQEAISLPNQNLLALEVVYEAEGLNTSMAKLSMIELNKSHLYANYLPLRAFHLTAHLPIKFYVFLSAPSHVIDRAGQVEAIYTGGPFREKYLTRPIVNI